MTESKLGNFHSPEVRARAVRMEFEHRGPNGAQVGAVAAIAAKIACLPRVLCGRVKQAEKGLNEMRGQMVRAAHPPRMAQVDLTARHVSMHAFEEGETLNPERRANARSV